MLARLGAVILALVVSGCAAPLPVGTSLPVVKRPSANHDERRPNFVILHYTSSATSERALQTLTDPVRRVSAHYLVDRSGKIFYLVDESRRAWHAGESFWGGNHDLNSASIGIEIDNNGRDAYSEPQIVALLALLADLKKRYGIPPANFLGHSDIAPTRKVDPGPHFPWRRLAAMGYGLWCDPPYEPVPPANTDAMLLAAVGYDVSDLPSAIAAFRLHYVPGEAPPRLTDDDRGLLNCLIAKRAQR